MWEYKYYQIRDITVAGGPWWMMSVEGDLNALGRNGWEVVNFDHFKGMILLKRQK